MDARKTFAVAELAQLLVEMTAALGWRAYSEHYMLDFPDITQARVSPTVVAPDPELGALWQNVECSPPSLHATLIQSFRQQSSSGGSGSSAVTFPRLAGRAGHSRWLSTIIVDSYSHFQQVHCGKTATEIARAIVIGLVEAGCGRHELDCLPVDIALPLREAIRLCRADPPGQWCASAYMLVGREDLAAQTRGDGAPDDGNSSTRSGGSSGIGGGDHNRSSSKGGSGSSSADADKDGMAISSDITAMRFGSDLRLREVRRMLNSVRPCRIKVEQATEVSDHDFIEQQKNALLLQIQRTMAAPVGQLKVHTCSPT